MNETISHEENRHIPPVPSRRDEAWRYTDIDTLAANWPRYAHFEEWAIPAGETHVRLILPQAWAQSKNERASKERLKEKAPKTPITKRHDSPNQETVNIRRINISLGKGAHLTLGALAAAEQYSRVEIHVTLESHAHFELGGIVLAHGEQLCEIITELHHNIADSTSHQTIRNVLGGEATGNFLGKINIARNAQRIDAAQSVKSMLLNRGPTVNTVPQLEIYADDVQCAHGATVGELDKHALFYSAARGLDPLSTKGLLLDAFVAEPFAGPQFDTVRTDIEKAAKTYLHRILT